MNKRDLEAESETEESNSTSESNEVQPHLSKKLRLEPPVEELQEEKGEDSKVAKQGRFIHGNFDHYYSFRNTTEAADRAAPQDPRLSYLAENDLKGKRVLDVGCNSGFLTLEIAKFYEPSEIIGIDLDSGLVQKALKNHRYAASTVKPEEAILQEGSVLPYFTNKNTSTERNLEYFPISMPQLFGVVPIVTSENINEDLDMSTYPYNLDYRCMNFMTDNVVLLGQFDSILLMSITKWIHLNHGDSGLNEFFKKATNLLKPGGTLFIEPQGYDTYSKSMWIFEHAKSKDFDLTLDIRPFKQQATGTDKTFWDILTELGLKGEVIKPVTDHAEDDAFARRPLWKFTKPSN